MRTYLITYDAACHSRQSLSRAIMQLGEAWARPLETAWYVQSGERAHSLERRLLPHLKSGDGLLIQQVEADAVMSNTALRWFRKRRQTDGDWHNVAVFPGTGVPEAHAA